jgi:RNA polymerase sigma-70 factor (ECF subfamily)
MQGLALCAPDTLASHRSFLYSYALAKLRQPSAAEELVQETLLAAVEGQAGFKGESKLRTWLTGILKHKIVDWHRSEARNPARASARPPARPPADPDDQYEDTCDALFDSAGNWVNPPSPWPNPEQSFESQRLWEMMECCLASLPAVTARAFYLREIQGLSTEEICTELGISQSNCWVMLHRARLGLRQSLEERWFMKDEVGAVSSRPAPRAAVAR